MCLCEKKWKAFCGSTGSCMLFDNLPPVALWAEKAVGFWKGPLVQHWTPLMLLGSWWSVKKKTKKNKWSKSIQHQRYHLFFFFFFIPHILLLFQNLAPTLPTMQSHHITGCNLSDHRQLPLEPQKALCYLFDICSTPQDLCLNMLELSLNKLF